MSDLSPAKPGLDTRRIRKIVEDVISAHCPSRGLSLQMDPVVEFDRDPLVWHVHLLEEGVKAFHLELIILPTESAESVREQVIEQIKVARWFKKG